MSTKTRASIALLTIIVPLFDVLPQTFCFAIRRAIARLLPILTLTDPPRHCSNYKRNVNVTRYAAALARVQSFFSCSHDAVIRVHDDAGNVIQAYEHKGDFKGW
jgi:hypothetical protein